MHLHGSVYEITGVGDICLSLPSGVLYTLRHVRYVPDLGGQSLISVRQLFDSGCHVVLLAQQSFSMQLGSLVIAHGARTYVVYPLLVPYARDGVVSIATLTCGEQEMRRLVEYSDATELELVVQRVCGVTHADGEISGDAQLGQSHLR